MYYALKLLNHLTSSDNTSNDNTSSNNTQSSNTSPSTFPPPPSLQIESTYSHLIKLDPSTNIHPNNKRKIRDEILRLTLHSKTVSKPYVKKREVCVVYIDYNDEILKTRIKKRIQKMVTSGLKTEIIQFYNQCVSLKLVREGGVPNVGLFQAIGFKEFMPFIRGYRTFEEVRKYNI